MNIPETLKYTKDHEWIKIDGNAALIGITDFAQGELGAVTVTRITYRRLVALGFYSSES